MIGDSPPFLPLFLRQFLRWAFGMVRSAVWFLIRNPRWLVGFIVVLALLELNASVRQAWLLVLGCVLLFFGALLRLRHY